MANYDDIKQKLMEVVNAISDKAVVVYDKAAAITKDLATQAQLNADIVREKNNMKNLLIELGSQYYAQYGEEPAEGVAQLCADISVSKAKVAELQELLSQAKEAAEKYWSEEPADPCCCETEAEQENCSCEAEKTAEECCCEAEKTAEECCCEAEKAAEECCGEAEKATEECCCSEAKEDPKPESNEE